MLTGVLVHFEAHALTMAATDSYRLAVREQPLEGGAPEPLEAIVPARALQEVARLAGSGEGGIDVVVQDNLVGFGIDGVQLTARRIDGQFPNFRSLLPDSHTHELTLPRAEVLDIVRRVGIFARQNAPVRVRLAAGELTISAQTPDVGDARESLPDRVQRRALRDRLQPGLPARRHRGRRRGRARAAPDLAAAARRCSRAAATTSGTCSCRSG